MRKAWLASAVLVAVLVAGTVFAMRWAGPMLTLRDIRTAMVKRDPVMLDPLIKWDTLRASVKHDAKQDIHEQNDGKFLEFLRNWIGDAVAESTVDTAGTPKGLIRLACDNKADGDFAATADKPCIIKGHLTAYGYEEKNRQRFDATLETDDHRVMRFIMGKNASNSRWQLINLQWVSKGKAAA